VEISFYGSNITSETIRNNETIIITAYDNDENNGKCDIYVDGKSWYSFGRDAKPINVFTFMTEDGVYSFGISCGRTL
jgi:hypothetical protein